MHDLVGLDLFWRKRKEEGTMDVNKNIADALCEGGRFGQKNGKGRLYLSLSEFFCVVIKYLTGNFLG
jgi:3-hydroxyacyl-CoA dehydrogenase